MKTVRFQKIRQALKGKGFALALIVSVGAVGASTYLAYDQAISKIVGTDKPAITTDKQTFTDPDIAPVQNDQQGVAKYDPSSPPVTTVPQAAYVPETEDAANNGEQAFAGADPQGTEVGRFISAPKRQMPLTGEVTVPFSNGELIKSKTLGVWKTHDGVDIAAPLGTPVAAVTDGSVSEVYSDPLWGVCVVIDHGDGAFSHYYGLDKNVPVNVGQPVKSGDVVGAVGNTAEMEVAEPAHLHFAVKRDGVWTDPIAFVGL